jgi:hypothetical protein
MSTLNESIGDYEVTSFTRLSVIKSSPLDSIYPDDSIHDSVFSSSSVSNAQAQSPVAEIEHKQLRNWHIASGTVPPSSLKRHTTNTIMTSGGYSASDEMAQSVFRALSREPVRALHKINSTRNADVVDDSYFAKWSDENRRMPRRDGYSESGSRKSMYQFSQFSHESKQLKQPAKLTHHRYSRLLDKPLIVKASPILYPQRYSSRPVYSPPPPVSPESQETLVTGRSWSPMLDEGSQETMFKGTRVNGGWKRRKPRVCCCFPSKLMYVTVI